MGTPLTTLNAIFEEEGRLLSQAGNKYGVHYGHACALTAYLSTFVRSVPANGEIFIRFMSHVKKHHTLALMSTVRRHKNQAMLNLRMVLESAANAAYALCHPEFKNFLVKGLDTSAKDSRRFPASPIGGWRGRSLITLPL